MFSNSYGEGGTYTSPWRDALCHQYDTVCYIILLNSVLKHLALSGATMVLAFVLKCLSDEDSIFFSCGLAILDHLQI